MGNAGSLVVHSKPGRSVSRGIARGEMLPVAAILGAVLLWGGSFSAMRMAVGAFNPWSVMWMRMVIALVLLAPFAGKLKLEAYRKGDWKLLAPMALLMPCFYFLLESYALCYTTSSQAGVISASVPLLVAIGAWLALCESISLKTVSGLTLSILGVAGLTLLGKENGAAESPLLGNALELCAMACAAANMILVKRLSNRYNPWTLTALQVLAGVVFFSPGLYLMIRAEAVPFTPGLAVAVLFLGAFVTLGAFGLYNWGMSHIPASRASMFINLVPVTAMFFGWGWVKR